MKQWQHILLKYLRNELFGVVLRCLPSEEAVELAILKKKSEGDVGPLALDPHHPPIFIPKPLNTNPCH